MCHQISKCQKRRRGVHGDLLGSLLRHMLAHALSVLRNWYLLKVGIQFIWWLIKMETFSALLAFVRENVTVRTYVCHEPMRFLVYLLLVNCTRLKINLVLSFLNHIKPGHISLESTALKNATNTQLSAYYCQSLGISLRSTNMEIVGSNESAILQRKDMGTPDYI